MRKLLLVVALVALIAAPAFAAVQNVKVSGNITSTLILDKFGDEDLDNQDVRGSDVLAQTQLNVEADLTDNVSTKIGLINERVWGSTADDVDGDGDALVPTTQTNVDLETAYVTMKEFLYSPLTVTVGRQPLVYGNSLIIASNNSVTNLGVYNDLSKRGNFDAIKAVLNFDPVTVDLFASRIHNGEALGVSKNDVTNLEANNDNENLFGINASTKLGDKMSTVLEGYLFARIDDTIKDDLAADPVKSDTTYVPGLRVSINPAEGLALQLEGAYQFGHVNTGTDQQTRDAYAFQGMVSFAVPGMKDLSPVLSAEFKYLSGNKQTQDNQKYGKDWDPMFEHQDNGRIFNVLGLADSNVKLVKLSAQITPLADVTTALSWYGIWDAAKYRDIPDSQNSSMYEGSELDADITYAYTEDVKLGLSAGVFMTGKAYMPDENKNATQILTSVSVAF
jgi:hypothetical protein